MWCKNAVRWLYKLEGNYAWDSRRSFDDDYFFRDKEGVVRLIIEASGKITVTSGYAWNGCSPKMCFLDILVGTPDGVVHARTGRPKTYFGSLIHDALYQFYPDGLPMQRRDADGIFRQLMAESEFAPGWVYWAFVRLFGGWIWRATRVKRKNHGTHHRVGAPASGVSEAAALRSN